MFHLDHLLRAGDAATEMGGAAGFGKQPISGLEKGASVLQLTSMQAISDPLANNRRAATQAATSATALDYVWQPRAAKCSWSALLATLLAMLPLEAQAQPNKARASSVTSATPSECATLSNEAQTLQRQGRLLAARERSIQCATSACPKIVSEECQGRLVTLGSAVPSLIFQVKDAADLDLSDVSISVDGQVLEHALEGTPLDIDPGKHELLFERSGYLPLAKTLIIAQGEQGRRERVVLTKVITPEAATTSLPQTTEAQAPSSLPTQVSDPAPSQSMLPTIALVTAGVGVLGLGASGVFTLLSVNAKTKSNQHAHCDSSNSCDETGLSYRQTSLSQASLATGFLIAGGVCLLGGATLFILSHTSEKSESVSLALSPVVARNTGGLIVHGWF